MPKSRNPQRIIENDRFILIYLLILSLAYYIIAGAPRRAFPRTFHPPPFGNQYLWNMTVSTNEACVHLAQIREVTPRSEGCEECLAMGDSWVHLRLCLICGHVGCCDSSRNKHATKHYRKTGHPIMKSMEPGEDWRWCYADESIV
jgi:hypothetical protein